MDEVTHDMDEFQRREARLRNRLHIMSVEGNNMEVYLHVHLQRTGYAATLPDILRIYGRHAPSIPAPGDYETSELFGQTTRPDGVNRWLLHERSDEFGDTELVFDTQMGMFSYRNRRIIAREDTRLTEEEREQRLKSLYNNLRHFDS